MNTNNTIQELEAKLLALKSKEQNKQIRKKWDEIKDFFEANKEKDFAHIRLDNNNMLESLYIKRVECVRHQPTLPGIGYMVADITTIQIGYDYQTVGFDRKYFKGYDTMEHSQEFMESNKIKVPTPVSLGGNMIISGGFPLKSKKSYKKEYAQILTTEKIQIHTDTIEFTPNGADLYTFTLGIEMIPKEVFDGLMKLYVKQTLESQEYLQNIDLKEITSVII